ncbi:MAG: alpha,alpha-trehalose-phosphate synthase (UDP-forming) [Alphaproteobacteria bacterium]|nr:alpha,alpha-trehalose-phosphate synthase (UDP-forming) [Alphaproteobacteria bacterium]MBU1516646.1 alpha,alpha-trehalose-phosphate synthase (UDP-forming) [Alphaproteobacteria bacterium]MBU2094402.1 alpha,alpha-trehalose-phosphate synthase (UDP-forming) [Alphaproteobacteria bacterium]MBU2153287.1 alpha,alpha-trehalose-phosphate synthase (UDP-forming) [Alphaproteobacteria bacterium]MBU2307573.1 alpha,alpha-trehalose-phosphate synthase (UDP-forming) [Alphaproteobacteria bacterium]
MGRLIVVSNRVQAPSDLGGGSAGGLAVALAAALREHSGLWFGWSGRTTETFTGGVQLRREGAVNVATIDLDEQDRQEYYNGYANKTLWPLFHYRTDLAAYERAFDAGYARVNERFAGALAPLVQADDTLWVHDYHLIPLAQALRRRGLVNRIGFFLHIPWPSRRVLTTLPRHRELVEALLDYDLIGFQTDDSRQAFEAYVTETLGGAVAADGTVTLPGRRSRIGAFPIGIDVKDFRAAAASAAAREVHKRMRRSMTGRKLILGVDRLDYSKGLEERFLAYEQFLADSAEQLENVFFLQIATLSRDEVEAYQDLRARLDAVSGRINGAYATIDWVPLRYVNRSYRRDELAGVYRAAHLALVTPLRDGMNLVAKEFVAAQDPEDPGVLVLSQFAGAAEQMPAALIVNPFSREELAEAIRRGLAMPKADRVSRWRELIEGVEQTGVSQWRDAFLGALFQGRGKREALPTQHNAA